MRRRAFFLIPLLLMPAACGAPAATQSQQPSAAVRYRTEQEWIVAEIVGAMAGMAEYAQTGKPGTADGVAVSVATAQGPKELKEMNAKAKPEPPQFTIQRDAGGPPLAVTVQHSIWWPADYAPIAATLFNATSGSTSSSSANASASATGTGAGAMDVSFITALLTPHAAVLIEQDARISKMLAADMRAARAHEQAALLLGTLALREAAGMFDDVRSTLSRMTAHLACAEALRRTQPQSAEGLLAETILQTLSGRQDAAMAGVRSIDLATAPEPLRAWVRALTLRITGDWRTLAEPHQASLLERLEYARAVHDRLGTNRLLAFLDPADGNNPIPDWQHIVLQRGFTAEAGNLFTGSLLSKDLSEASDVWAAYHGASRLTQPAAATVMADLNDTPWPTPVHAANRTGNAQSASVHVIDWGRWAAFLQRHICSHLRARANQHRAWGGTEEKAQFFDHIDKVFGTLLLYPIVLRATAIDGGTYTQAMTRARKLATEHPESLTAEAWYLLVEQPTGYKAPHMPFTSEKTWFSGQALLPGAPFETSRRALRPKHWMPPEYVERVKEMRPYDSWAAWAAAYSRSNDKPTLDLTLAALGPLAEYDTVAMARLYTYLPLTGEQTITIARQMCDADVDRCDHLAAALLRARRDAEAAKIYEQWADGARDRGNVSNGLTWVVRYYVDAHRDDRARELAAIAGEAGSETGLETQADLLDRQGNHEEAEALYQRIAQRYYDASLLGAFYQRMARRSHEAKYEINAKQALLDAFEDGIEPIAPDALTSTAPPQDGMSFGSITPRALACGIHQGDIIVAVDGTRIHNWNQYRVASRFVDTNNDRMDLVVWREGRYQTLKLKVPQRWFALDLHDYTRPDPSRRDADRLIVLIRDQRSTS